MRHALVVVVVAWGTSACGDALNPRPDVSSLAASSDVAPQSDPAARGMVLPSAYANVMGEYNNIFPHSWANTRYQQVFLGSELGTLRSVGGLCLRRDELVVFPSPAQTQRMTVKLGPTELDHTTLTDRFDDNYSAAPTTVFSGDVDIPASSGGGTADDFYICIDFTTVYLHPADRNVVVEIVNTSTTSIPNGADACLALPGVPGFPELPPSAGCTTARVFAFDANATNGVRDQIGLIMKFVEANPSTKDDCKDGRWEGYGFDNQGQCIRFVETGDDSRTPSTE